MPIPLIANLGGTELLFVLALILLFFGASKLPGLARGAGSALRIFKAEATGSSTEGRIAPEPPEGRLQR